MGLGAISFVEFKLFLAVLVRISALLLVFPFFNARAIPVLCKAGLILSLTLILFPLLDGKPLAFPDTPGGMLQLVANELMAGMTLGLLVQVFFEGIRMMGQVVGFQTGFAITNIIDPQSGVQVSIFSNMAYLVAMIFFLLLNGHHLLLAAIRESFDTLPVASFGLNGMEFERIMQLYGGMFVVAFKIGAPPIVALLLTQLAFGLITKFIPQMNIMIVAFQVQIVIGLFFFGISISLLLSLTEAYLGGLGVLLKNTMVWLRV